MCKLGIYVKTSEGADTIYPDLSNVFYSNGSTVTTGFKLACGAYVTGDKLTVDFNVTMSKMFKNDYFINNQYSMILFGLTVRYQNQYVIGTSANYHKYISSDSGKMVIDVTYISSYSLSLITSNIVHCRLSMQSNWFGTNDIVNNDTLSVKAAIRLTLNEI